MSRRWWVSPSLCEGRFASFAAPPRRGRSRTAPTGLPPPAPSEGGVENERASSAVASLPRPIRFAKGAGEFFEGPVVVIARLSMVAGWD